MTALECAQKALPAQMKPDIADKEALESLPAPWNQRLYQVLPLTYEANLAYNASRADYIVDCKICNISWNASPLPHPSKKSLPQTMRATMQLIVFHTNP